MNIRDLISSPQGEVIEKLEQAGYEGYFVGGCVRDALMGRDCNDIDVTTNATPEQVMQVFADHKVVGTGLKHGTVTVLMGEPVEVTTFRREGAYTDHRHPDQVIFVQDIKEDLARRDFTMNAIAADRRGGLVDPFGGQKDIADGVIRAVGDPESRFREDALRIMRAVRFCGQLGFTIEPDTEHAMFTCKALLGDISGERLFEELKKLVVAPYAGEAIERYVQILSVFLPHFEVMDGFEQHNPAHQYDVLRHCIKCMQNLRVTEENQVYMKLAGLFHDIGKPDTFAFDEKGIGHCFGHPAVSADHTEEILRGLKADNFTIQRVTLITRYHDLLFRKDPKLLKKWLNRFGPEVLFELLEIKRADNLAVGCDVTRLITMFDEIKIMLEKILANEECFTLQDLQIDGNDIIRELGVKGPQVGEILNGLLNAVIEERIHNEKKPLLEEAARLAQEGNSC